nr:zinc finger protein Pegasus [Ciona intestinalis]|eukprot:XP_002131180.1 zinc finger protein Pegasus [Ciona intestinalis]
MQQTNDVSTFGLNNSSVSNSFVETFNLQTQEASNSFKDSEKERNKCPHCPFTTAWKSSLSVHIKTHTNERPWKCALCNKHFKLKHHLKCHLLTHSNKQAKCNLCSFRCSDSRMLQRHKLLSHKVGFKKRMTPRPTLTMPMTKEFAATADNTFNSFFGHSNDQAATLGQPANVLDTPGFGYKVPAIPTQNESFQPPEIRKSPNRVLWQRSVPTHQFNQQPNAISSSNLHQRWPIITTCASTQDCLPPEKAMYRRKSSDLASVSSTDSTPILVKQERPHVVESSSEPTPTCFAFPSQSSDLQQIVSADESNTSDCRIVSPQSATPSDANNEVVSKRSRSLSARSIASVNIEEPLVLEDETKVESKWECSHCGIIFPDNIMYGLHMACHSVGHAYKCNVCGLICRDRHDFSFHFSLGQHKVDLKK